MSSSGAHAARGGRHQPECCQRPVRGVPGRRPAVPGTQPHHTDQPNPETCWTQAGRQRFQMGCTAYHPAQLDQYQNTPGADWPVRGRRGRPWSTSRRQAADHDNLQVRRHTESGVAGPVLGAVAGRGGSGQVYAGGPQGACGQPPEASGGLSSALPSNETYGVTASTGAGSAEFDVFTKSVNTTLGCSDTVAVLACRHPDRGDQLQWRQRRHWPRTAGPAATAALQDCEAGVVPMPRGRRGRTGSIPKWRPAHPSRGACGGARLTGETALWCP